MKKYIITTAITACLALCAAVWPQTEMVKETPMPDSTAAVIAPLADVPEPGPFPAPTAIAVPAQEQPEQLPAEVIIPTVPERKPEPVVAVEQTPKSTISEQEHETEPKITQEPAEPEASAEQRGDMVYVPGFGWLESQGPNHVEYAEDMYENGNKTGIMGCPPHMSHAKIKLKYQQNSVIFPMKMTKFCCWEVCYTMWYRPKHIQFHKIIYTFLHFGLTLIWSNFSMHLKICVA